MSPASPEGIRGNGFFAGNSHQGVTVDGNGWEATEADVEFKAKIGDILYGWAEAGITFTGKTYDEGFVDDMKSLFNASPAASSSTGFTITDSSQCGKSGTVKAVLGGGQ